MCLVRKHLPIVYETSQWKNIAPTLEIFFPQQSIQKFNWKYNTFSNLEPNIFVYYVVIWNI